MTISETRPPDGAATTPYEAEGLPVDDTYTTTAVRALCRRQGMPGWAALPREALVGLLNRRLAHDPLTVLATYRQHGRHPYGPPPSAAEADTAEVHTLGGQRVASLRATAPAGSPARRWALVDCDLLDPPPTAALRRYPAVRDAVRHLLGARGLRWQLLDGPGT